MPTLPHDVTAGLATTLAKIRALWEGGFSRTEISDHLKIRYQHVRNVLAQAGADRDLPTAIAPSRALRAKGRRAAASSTVNFRRALVLVSCTKSKLSRPAAARDLYTSSFFKMARSLVEREKADWRILSAEHGLVAPDHQVVPYERTLNNMPIAARRAWAASLLDDLLTLATPYNRVIILAGVKYREFIVGPLLAAGITVEMPMEGLKQGEQLAWLSAR